MGVSTLMVKLGLVGLFNGKSVASVSQVGTKMVPQMLSEFPSCLIEHLCSCQPQTGCVGSAGLINSSGEIRGTRPEIRRQLN